MGKKRVVLRHTAPPRHCTRRTFPPAITMRSAAGGQLPPVGLDCPFTENCGEGLRLPLLELACEGTLADVDREIDCIKLPVWAEGVSGFDGSVVSGRHSLLSGVACVRGRGETLGLRAHGLMFRVLRPSCAIRPMERQVLGECWGGVVRR